MYDAQFANQIEYKRLGLDSALRRFRENVRDLITTQELSQEVIQTFEETFRGWHAKAISPCQPNAIEQGPMFLSDTNTTPPPHTSLIDSGSSVPPTTKLDYHFVGPKKTDDVIELIPLMDTSATGEENPPLIVTDARQRVPNRSRRNSFLSCFSQDKTEPSRQSAPSDRLSRISDSNHPREFTVPMVLEPAAKWRNETLEILATIETESKVEQNTPQQK